MGTPIRAHCANCGNNFTSSSFFSLGGGATAKISNIGVDCPRCGSMAMMEDGIYSAIGKIVDAVRVSPGGIENLLAFQTVAIAVQDGSISRLDAAAKTEELGGAYLDLWKWINSNGAALGVVIAIIACCIGYYAIIEANAGSNQAHLDATQAHLDVSTLLHEVETQTQLSLSTRDEAQSVQQLHKKIYDLFIQRPQSARPPTRPTQPTLTKQQASSQQKPKTATAQENRHERRKAEKLAKTRDRPL